VSLTLYVDFARWYAHLRSVVAGEPDLVPVAKGNGYGFTVRGLARAAGSIGVDCVAVGSADDAAAVLGEFPGEVVVLGCAADGDPGAAVPRSEQGRVIYTAASLEAASQLADRRLIVDCRSSLLRQGIDESEIGELRHVLGGRRVEGFSLHLPIDRPAGSDPVGETARWVERLSEAGFEVPVMYVSHLERAEIEGLGKAFPGTRFRPRVGTRLWLGDRRALCAAATVLQSFPIRRGDRIGYRQDRSAHDGWLVVVSGGTAHGVGLEAPKTLRGLGPRVRALARYGLASANRVRSPFSWEGRKQWFAEPPHMLVSMLLFPRRVEPPWAGAELMAELRHTATSFDRVVAM